MIGKDQVFEENENVSWGLKLLFFHNFQHILTTWIIMILNLFMYVGSRMFTTFFSNRKFQKIFKWYYESLLSYLLKEKGEFHDILHLSHDVLDFNLYFWHVKMLDGVQIYQKKFD